MRESELRVLGIMKEIPVVLNVEEWARGVVWLLLNSALNSCSNWVISLIIYTWETWMDCMIQIQTNRTI